MAYVKRLETKRTKNGKAQPSYQVRWQEPARDSMGLPIPINPDRPHGQMKQVHHKETYPSKEAAQERCDELNAARHRTTAISAAEQRKAGDLPFGYYAAAWLEAMDVKVAQGRLKERTADDYRRLLSRYVLEPFGGQAVASITPRQAERFLADLVRREARQGTPGDRLSPATVKHAWSVFRRVLKYAMQHDAIPSNPADRVDFGTGRAVGDHEKFEHHPLTAAQIAELSAAVAGRATDAAGARLPAYPIYGLMVEFLAYTGIRSAELAGLEVGDLAFTTAPGNTDAPLVRCVVNIRRTKNRKDGQWVTSTPKSRRSRRSVPLPPWLAERMHAYLATDHPRADDPCAPLWPSRKNGGGHRAAGHRYAVPFDWTQPLAPGTFYDTVFRPALAAVGLPASAPAIDATDNAPARPATRGVRLHDLRHTFAVMHLMAGTHFMQVSRWLGHGTFTLTLDTYGDWIPEEDGGAGNNLPEPERGWTDMAHASSNVIQLFGR